MTAGDNTSGTGAKPPPGADGDKGHGSKGEELKKSSEGGEGSEAGGEEREEEEEWEQVGPKNKSTITRQVVYMYIFIF